MHILLAIVVPVALIVAYASTRPSDFRIARSRVIDASPEALFALIEDFHKWAAWSPWDKMDPAMLRTFEGPERGVGAVYRWRGNSKVGEGSMTIREAVAGERMVFDLHFLKPFPAQNVGAFALTPEGSGTRVEWSMTGRNALPAKVFGLFMNMDEMVGRDFEKGLAAMEQAAKA